jgi:putative ABC transport system substrate-binding protein
LKASRFPSQPRDYRDNATARKRAARMAGGRTVALESPLPADFADGRRNSDGGERMSRGDMLLAFSVLAASYPFPSTLAQTAVPLIGRISTGSATDPLHDRNMRHFHDGMRALGHVEGRTYRLESRFAEGDGRRLPALVADLLKRDVRIILASGSASVRAAKAATADRPIVMAMAAIDPVRAGFAASLARPGGNITGMTGLLEDLNTKHLELVRELMPERPDVMVLYQTDSVSRRQIAEITAIGDELKLKMRFAGIVRVDDLAPAVAEARRANVGGIVVLPAPAIMDRNRALIADLALQHRLPSISALRIYADAGGLVSYGVDLGDIYRRAAGYVHKILKGAKPADLPIEQPTKFQLVINLKTAKALGLKMPAELLARADEVIE